jgi:hypothetical protein
VCDASVEALNARNLRNDDANKSSDVHGGTKTMRRNYYIGLAFAATLLPLGLGTLVLERRSAVEAAAVQAPMFEVDPFWPKPLPNHWLIGMTIGVSVDAQDNVWIVHR